MSKGIRANQRIFEKTLEIFEDCHFFSYLVTTKTTWTNITGLAMTNWVDIDIKKILGPKLRAKLDRGQ